MNSANTKMFVIKLPYWLGIAADALWAVALFYPPIFGMLTGNENFNPDQQTRIIMGIGGILMTGWTILLIWALTEPIGRRFVILVTAFPVVFGLFVVSLIGFQSGNSGNIWILAKTIILFLTMITSYLLAGKQKRRSIQK